MVSAPFQQAINWRDKRNKMAQFQDDYFSDAAMSNEQ